MVGDGFKNPGIKAGHICLTMKDVQIFCNRFGTGRINLGPTLDPNIIAEELGLPTSSTVVEVIDEYYIGEDKNKKKVTVVNIQCSAFARNR